MVDWQSPEEQMKDARKPQLTSALLGSNADRVRSCIPKAHLRSVWALYLGADVDLWIRVVADH
jgi:hypothetical protein